MLWAGPSRESGRGSPVATVESKMGRNEWEGLLKWSMRVGGAAMGSSVEHESGKGSSVEHESET